MKLESIALTPLRLMAFSILSLFRPIVLGLLDGFAVLALVGIVGSAICGYWFVCGVMVATGVCSISLVWSYDAILSRLVPYDFAVLSNP